MVSLTLLGGLCRLLHTRGLMHAGKEFASLKSWGQVGSTLPFFLTLVLIAGDFPWSAGVSSGENGSLAARAYYARRYRTAMAHLMRAQEEQVILKKEVIRAINWVEEGSAAIQERIAALERLAGADDASAAERRTAAGQTALLTRELSVLAAVGPQLLSLR
jgi:hypothetical protein